MVRHEARIVDEIYILGDLVEMWLATTIRRKLLSK